MRNSLSAQLKVLFFFIAVCIAVVSCQTDTNVDAKDSPFRGTRNVDFDWNLAKLILQPQKSNAVLSPLLVKVLLVLLYEATGDTISMSAILTKKELKTVLEPTGDLDATRTLYYQWLDSALAKPGGNGLELATNFFVEEYIDATKKFLGIADYYYSATADKVPFSKPDEAVSTINNWAQSSSKGRFPEIVTVDHIEGAVITLMNTVYLKGLWTYPFPENGLQLAFHTTQKEVQTDFMEQNGQFYYGDSSILNAQLLRLPYRGGKFAMYFVLPHESSSIEDVMEQITPTLLHKAMEDMEKTDVNVIIPKFRFDSMEKLNQPLQDIGIHEIFSPNSSLPLLARGKGARNEVRVCQVFQKTGISINESGSEMDSTIETQPENNAESESTQAFTADRPFLFFIEDEDFGTLLFAGRVEDPTI